MSTYPLADITAPLVKDWFTNCDEDVKTVIQEVLILELENISMKSPHLKTPIKEIISRVAAQKTK